MDAHVCSCTLRTLSEGSEEHAIRLPSSAIHAGKSKKSVDDKFSQFGERPMIPLSVTEC